MATSKSLNKMLVDKETVSLIEDLDQRLRSQIDRLEILKLSVAEVRKALSSSNNSPGSGCMEQTNVDLKRSLAEHTAFLCDLNERVESLQMSTTLLVQACNKPKVWGSRRTSRRYRTRPHFYDDTQSELGFNAAWQCRNSDAASEMSCAW